MWRRFLLMLLFLVAVAAQARLLSSADADELADDLDMELLPDRMQQLQTALEEWPTEFKVAINKKVKSLYGMDPNGLHRW